MFICKGNNTGHKSTDTDRHNIADVSQQWLTVTLGHIEHALLLSCPVLNDKQVWTCCHCLVGLATLGWRVVRVRFAGWCMTVEHVLGWQTAKGRVTLGFRWNSVACQRALSLSPSARMIPLLDMHVKYKQISAPQGHLMIKEGAKKKERERFQQHPIRPVNATQKNPQSTGTQSLQGFKWDG